MKLVKNIFYNASFQLLSLILPLITVPYVSRVLLPEGIGINAYTYSILSYFLLIGVLGTTVYGNREIAFVQRDDYQRSKIFWEIVVLKFFSVGIASLAYLIFILSQSKWQTYYLLQGITLIATMVDISWYYTGIEDFKKIVVRNAIIKFTTVILTFIFVKEKSDLGLYIFLIAFSTLLGNLSVWPFLKNEVIKLPLKELQVSRHLIPTLKLFLPQLTMQIYLSLNKSMLGVMDSVVSAGYFDQSDKIIRVLFTLVTAIGGVFLPRLASLFSENRHTEAKSLLLNLLYLSNAISMLLIAGVIGVSSTFATTFFGKEYAAVGPLMAVQSAMILMISYGNALGAQYLLASRRNKDYTFSAVAGLITNIICNLILIPLWGVMGAIVTSVLTEFAVSAYQAYSLRDIFTAKELTHGLGRYLLAGGIVAALLYVLNSHMPVGWLTYILLAGIGSILYLGLLWIMKAPLFEVLKEFKKSQKVD